MSQEINDSINMTRQGFEESFESEDFYNNQTRDEDHLKLILNCLKVGAGIKVLDLGTGTGYLAFSLAEKYTNSEIIGLDIVEKTLHKNRMKAEVGRLKNLRFVSYDGMKFPFDNKEFDLVISRYALHHFPKIGYAFQEINRVLKPGGKFFLSDPAPNDNDTNRFVDAYMQMKKDGHIKFYTKMEWEKLGKSTGFNCIECFETYIRFPKKRETAFGFEDILNRFDRDVIDSYNVEITAEEIWITEKVNNLLLQKNISR